MLCYVMLCYVTLCYATLCFTLCYAMLRYVTLCYVMLLRYATLCYVILRYATLSRCLAVLHYNVVTSYILWNGFKVTVQFERCFRLMEHISAIS